MTSDNTAPTTRELIAWAEPRRANAAKFPGGEDWQIVQLADALGAVTGTPDEGLRLLPNPPMPPDELLHQIRSDAPGERDMTDLTAGLRAIWRHGCDAGMIAGRVGGEANHEQ